MSIATHTHLAELKKAVRQWIDEEHTPHQDKDGVLQSWADDPNEHGNPQDCLQCRVEELLR